MRDISLLSSMKSSGSPAVGTTDGTTDAFKACDSLIDSSSSMEGLGSDELFD
jgi:hypothetical protein